jgi:TetR/AcrR family transcriptional regulator, copper-responsive repressor
MKKVVTKPSRARGRPLGFDPKAALERAMEVFWRHGYEATSISELTRAMGINPPSLYAAFGDKERLFLAAVEHYTCGIGRTPAAVLEEAPTAREAIGRLLEKAAREFTDRRHPPGCLLIMAATNCSAESAHVQAALAKRRKAGEAAFMVRILRGVRDGELPAGTDARALGKLYYTVFEGMSIQARDGATRKSLLSTAAAAMRAWPAAKAKEEGS